MMGAITTRKEFQMKTTVDRVGWGLMLIVAGGVFMARNLGYQIDLTPAAGMVVASGLSVLSFIRYFAGDRKRWGRLMPACVLAAVAVMIGLSEADASASIIVMPLFISLAIPFAVALAAEPQKNYRAAIPLTVFTCLTLIALLHNAGLNAGPLVLIAAGIVLLINSLQPRRVRVP
jgi:hypothetical protein